MSGGWRRAPRRPPGGRSTAGHAGGSCTARGCASASPRRSAPRTRRARRSGRKPWLGRGDVGVHLDGVTEVGASCWQNPTSGGQARCRAWSTMVAPSANSRRAVVATWSPMRRPATARVKSGVAASAVPRHPQERRAQALREQLVDGGRAEGPVGRGGFREQGRCGRQAQYSPREEWRGRRRPGWTTRHPPGGEGGHGLREESSLRGRSPPPLGSAVVLNRAQRGLAGGRCRPDPRPRPSASVVLHRGQRGLLLRRCPRDPRCRPAALAAVGSAVVL